MGFLTSLFGRSADDDQEEQEKQSSSAFSNLTKGMTLQVEAPGGVSVLTGQLTAYDREKSTLTLERLPGALSLGTREMGTGVVIRGINDKMTPFALDGTVQESTRTVCRLKNVKPRNTPEHRQDFRLHVGIPVTMYYQADERLTAPEECILVDISVGGACIESEFLHAEDEVLRLKVKLEDYAPMEFLGEVIRVVEYKPGKFRYGFLFAQLKESELTELTRTLYNIQAGNRKTWMRSDEGHW